jgi:4-oxalocrotonate tautomerase
MPFIQINLPTTLASETREELIREVVERTHQAIGSDPAIINVVVHELPPANVSVGGHTRLG